MAALMEKLAQTEEAEWEDIFEQLKPAGRAQLKADAAGALNASRDFDYLEDEAREEVVIRMMVTPREGWLALLRQILKEDAEEIAAQKESGSSASSESSLQEESSSSKAESSSQSEEEEEEEESSSSKSESSKPQSSKSESSSKPQSSSKPESSKPGSSQSEDEEDEDEDEYDDLGTLKVYNLAKGRTVTGSVYDIVSQVVQNEMGSFHEEALKAQAVAAYSYILHENNAGRTPNMRLSAPTTKVEKATREVLGEALYYKGKVAFTPFYATSAGATNSSADVWGGSYPYLVSVDSSVDENARNFEYQKTISVEKVRDLLEDYFSGIELQDDPEEWFEVLSYTDGGYNKKMKAGNKSTTGRVLRESVLSLRSAAFDWECDGEDFVFGDIGITRLFHDTRARQLFAPTHRVFKRDDKAFKRPRKGVFAKGACAPAHTDYGVGVCHDCVAQHINARGNDDIRVFGRPFRVKAGQNGNRVPFLIIFGRARTAHSRAHHAAIAARLHAIAVIHKRLADCKRDLVLYAAFFYFLVADDGNHFFSVRIHSKPPVRLLYYTHSLKKVPLLRKVFLDKRIRAVRARVVAELCAQNFQGGHGRRHVNHPFHHFL
jgi:SpoIID/LytB domain protein